MGGEYTKMHDHTYMPEGFRCMQVGITWSPDMTASSLLRGDRDEVVFACQQTCRDTEGCKHFTVMFPSLCRLAAAAAVSVPAENTISGPPVPECEDVLSEAPLAHTFMKKFEAESEFPVPVSSSTSLPRVSQAVGAIAISASFVAAVVLCRRRRSNESWQLMNSVDLEESLQLTTEVE